MRRERTTPRGNCRGGTYGSGSQRTVARRFFASDMVVDAQLPRTVGEADVRLAGAEADPGVLVSFEPRAVCAQFFNPRPHRSGGDRRTKAKALLRGARVAGAGLREDLATAEKPCA